MSKEETMKPNSIFVTLPWKLVQQLEGLVEEGMYLSVNEIIREAIRYYLIDACIYHFSKS